LLQLLQASNVNQGVLACKSIPENIFAWRSWALSIVPVHPSVARSVQWPLLLRTAHIFMCPSALLFDLLQVFMSGAFARILTLAPGMQSCLCMWWWALDIFGIKIESLA
jgi:hypothetical protein